MKCNRILVATLLAGTASFAEADEIVTTDGSTLNGTIIQIAEGAVTIETAFAGQISISQEMIASFSTDNPIYLTVNEGSTYLGPVEGDESGLTIRSDEGTLSTQVVNITESWQPGVRSPSAISADRKWAYEAAFDLTGKTGNSDSNGLATLFNATLDGPQDRLEFFARVNYEETDDQKSADDAAGGITYSNKIGPNLNWYVRSEIGRDVIKDIELYVTTAAGLGYTFYDADTRYLDLRAGLGYVFESYDDVLRVDGAGTPIRDVDGNLVFDPRPDQSTASLDFGLNHKQVFGWSTLRNRLTFTPAIDDFSNFRVVHDTSIEMPLKAQGWSIRTGINNRYDSEADLSDKEELDTTYYLRMVLRWL